MVVAEIPFDRATGRTAHGVVDFAHGLRLPHGHGWIPELSPGDVVGIAETTLGNRLRTVIHVADGLRSTSGRDRGAR